MSKLAAMLVLLISASLLAGCSSIDELLPEGTKITIERDNDALNNKDSSESDKENDDDISASLNEKVKMDSRILLTNSNNDEYNPSSKPNCNEAFNSDDADSKVRYSSQENGLSFDVPYNANWGSENYRINPYDAGDGSISFGPIGTFENCMWARDYFLHFRPAKTYEEALKDITDQISNSISHGKTKPGTTEINGLTVIEYTLTGMCEYPIVHVIGNKFNYELVPLCSVDVEKDFAFMEEIVKSMKLSGESQSDLLSYSSDKYSFNYPSEYVVTTPSDSFPVLTVEKARNKRLEIFQISDFPGHDRPFGFTGAETQDDIDEYVNKEGFVISPEGIWRWVNDVEVSKNDVLSGSVFWKTMDSFESHMNNFSAMEKKYPDQTYEVWLFYSASDTDTKKELLDIVETLDLKSENESNSSATTTNKTSKNVYVSKDLGYELTVPDEWVDYNYYVEYNYNNGRDGGTLTGAGMPETWMETFYADFDDWNRYELMVIGKVQKPLYYINVQDYKNYTERCEKINAEPTSLPEERCYALGYSGPYYAVLGKDAIIFETPAPANGAKDFGYVYYAYRVVHDMPQRVIEDKGPWPDFEAGFKVKVDANSDETSS